MCGICGFISKQNITRDELHAMNETMIHRGPDDGGVEIYPMKQGYSIGLAQRRLAILDLSILKLFNNSSDHFLLRLSPKPEY